MIMTFDGINYLAVLVAAVAAWVWAVVRLGKTPGSLPLRYSRISPGCAAAARRASSRIE